MNRKINKVQYKEKDKGVEHNIQVHLRKKQNPEKKISETLSIVESQGLKATIKQSKIEIEGGVSHF